MSVINIHSYPKSWAGILVAFASAVAFALSNGAANLAYHAGSNALTVATVRFVLTSLTLVVWLGFGRISLALTRRDTAIAVGLGLVTALYSWALLKSFNAIPFALAILVFYLFPLISAAIVGLLGWEKFGWRTVAAIVLALIGLALALDLRTGHLDVGGVALALLAAFGWAGVITVSSHVFGKGDARPLTLCMMVAASVLLLMICLASGEFALPRTSAGWISFMVASELYGFAIIAFFVAVSMIGPLRTSLLAYADAVVSAGLGVFLLGQTLTVVQLVGIALVIAALIGATLSK